jgi:hypothetical protein
MAQEQDASMTWSRFSRRLRVLPRLRALPRTVEGRLEPQAYCHRPGTDRRSAAQFHIGQSEKVLLVVVEYARRESAPQQSPMGLCCSAVAQLRYPSVRSRSRSIGGLLAEGQTPAARGGTTRRSYSIFEIWKRLVWVSFERPNVSRGRSDKQEPGGDAWRGDGTGVECFNDVFAVQPAVSRLASVACVARNAGRPPRATGLLPSPREHVAARRLNSTAGQSARQRRQDGRLGSAAALSSRA